MNTEFRGFTKEELKVAFESVCDKENWKNSVSGARIRLEDLYKVNAAVEYYTGAGLTEVNIDPPEKGKIVECAFISFDGYYATMDG